MDTQAGAQFATNSQTTIDLQAGIIASHQDEIGRANVKLADQAAEIDRLNLVLADRQAKIAQLMGEAVRAEIDAGDADEIALLKRQIDNLKRHIAEYCPAAPAAPSEQARNGFALMPTEINDVVRLGFAYLDAAREDMPNESWSFSHAGYRAMVVAAAAAPAAPLPAQPEPSERTCYEDNDGATRCISCHANHDQNQDHGEDCWVDRAEKVSALAASQPLPKEGGAVYGIIDPDYGRIYTMVRKLAWEEGYAIGLHGSFTRDLDLIAVPWDDGRRCNPKKLVARILQATGLKEAHGNPGTKPHGRLVWTLLLPEFGDPRFVDLSIMPAESERASTEDKQ